MTNKIKLIFINTVNLEENGISSFILNNSYILTNWNVEVTIIAPNKVNSDLQSALRKNNINLIELPMRNKKPYVYFVKLLSIFKKKKCDVVHVNGNSTTMSIELLAAYLAGIKIRIAHSHNTTTDHKRINKLLRPIFDVVANGRIACNTAAGKWLFKNKNFLVIRNGINLSNFKFDATMRKKYRDKLGLNENDILLGHVGRFNRQKNQHFLLDLMNHLDSKYHLVLIGSGMNYHELKTEVKQSKELNTRVTFTGPIKDTSVWLSAMDVFLLPSLYEGQPYTLIEATASGLNSIVSDTVSKENDIADNIIFESIKKSRKWIGILENQIVKDRDTVSNKYIQVLKKAGYDSTENAKNLLRYYQNKLLNRR